MRSSFFARLISIVFISAAAPAFAQTSWKERLQKSVNELDAEFPGQFGFDVRQLNGGDRYSFRAEEKWYIASGVKLAVALEVFRQIDLGKLSLETALTLEDVDLVDGPGPLSLATAGSKHSVKYLLEQMLMLSDNTASDLLIRKVGLANVNALAKGFGFNRITTLAQVRRILFGHLHPNGSKLTGAELLKVGKARSDKDKTAVLEELLGVPTGEWNVKTIEGAYVAYYAAGLNSTSLKSVTRLLGKLSRGELLKPESTAALLDMMKRAETGENRIKSALPAGVTFAHKTGTQRKRVCDFGIASRDGRDVALISACVRGVSSAAQAERILARLGKALSDSGIFTTTVVSDE